MPEATLKFNLPEEKEDFDLASNAGKLHSVIYDLLQELRCSIKYKTLTEVEQKTYEEIQKSVFDLIEDYGISNLFS